MNMTNKTYDILKYIALIVLPAVATLVISITGIWGLPYGEPIAATITLSFPATVSVLGRNLVAQSWQTVRLFIVAGKVPTLSGGNLYDALRPYRVSIIYPREYAAGWRAAIETANAHGGNGYYTKYFEFGGFYAGRPRATI